jgi:hypothetical protein
MGYAHRVEGGQRIKLEQFDPGENAGLKLRRLRRKPSGASAS